MAEQELDERIPGPVTEDSLLRGRVKLVQPTRGFRSSLDPVLLAGFVAAPFGRFVDIGAGTGALALSLLALDPAARGVAVELQPRLAECLRLGVERNGWQDRLEVVEGDVRAWSDSGAFDLVATNPPYQPLGRGVLPPDRERAIAHHEVSLTLAEWVAVAARMLAPSGRVAVVFGADREDELVRALADQGLGNARMRRVVPEAGRPARRVLVEAHRGPPTLTQETPLVVHEGGGFTAAVRAMLGDTPSS